MTPTYSDTWLDVYAGDCREVLAALPADSVHCVVTSPPYYGLRDYGLPPSVWEAQRDPGLRPKDHVHDFATQHQAQRTAPAGSAKQASNRGANSVTASSSTCACGAWLGVLGLEPTPELYVAHLVEVFEAVRRVLRPDGTLWLNLGDSFGEKQLTGIPWRVAFALQAAGWYLRRDVIWDKPNPMPESVRDRPTSSHEYVFLMAKSPRYYFDAEAVREPAVTDDMRRPYGSRGGWEMDGRPEEQRHGGQLRKSAPRGSFDGKYAADSFRAIVAARNIRSVWRIATTPYPDAHFATFPPELPERCILAGTSERGACPACGAPWQRVVAHDIPVDAGRSEDSKLRGAAGLSPIAASAAQRRLGQAYQDQLNAAPRTSTWRPGCAHGVHSAPTPDLTAEDLEVIATPANGRGDEPLPGKRGRLDTARRGLDRERVAGEGVRPITRYEQRRYAAQLRALSEDRRDALVARLGVDAWEHYVRTDHAGARPLPAEVLAELLEAGVLEYVAPPDWQPLEPVPCVVLDPFAGSGTVGMVAGRLSRRAVLVDMNPEYVAQQMKRNAQAPLGLSTT